MEKKMLCPKCQKKTKVYDSRPQNNTVRRSRECLICKHRFASIEILEVRAEKPKPPPKPKAPRKRELTPFKRERRPARKKDYSYTPRRSHIDDFEFEMLSDDELDSAEEVDSILGKYR
jgi:hypothetical protein